MSTRTAFTTLRGQMADWNDLSLAHQEAALEIWRNHGHAAACVYCLGA